MSTAHTASSVAVRHPPVSGRSTTSPLAGSIWSISDGPPSHSHTQSPFEAIDRGSDTDSISMNSSVLGAIRSTEPVSSLKVHRYPPASATCQASPVESSRMLSRSTSPELGSMRNMRSSTPAFGPSPAYPARTHSPLTVSMTENPSPKEGTGIHLVTWRSVSTR